MNHGLCGQAHSEKRTFNAEKPPEWRFFLYKWSEWRDLNPRHPAPKAGALPTALHPVIELFNPAGRILPNHPRYQLRYTRIRLFCFLLSVVIYVVKAGFWPGFAAWKIPQAPVRQGVPGFGGSYHG